MIPEEQPIGMKLKWFILEKPRDLPLIKFSMKMKWINKWNKHDK